MMPKIRFSHKYYKMPTQEAIEKGKHTLIGIQIHEDIYKLPEEFLHYDASFWNGKETEEYPIPLGKGIVIFIFTCYESENKVWTSIRRWTPWKEKYYRDLKGKEVEIVIEKGKQ